MPRYYSEEELTRIHNNKMLAYENIGKYLPRIAKALEALAKAVHDEPPRGEKKNYTWKES
jgi:hypothetical protein